MKTPYLPEKHTEHETRNLILTAAGFMALGAGMMYLLDPRAGRRRRGLIRDQLIHATRQTSTAACKTADYMRGKLTGLAAETRGFFRQDEPDDPTLEARVRSAIGRACSHPHALQVRCRGGRVTLAGPILSHEVDCLLSAVWHTRGVREIINCLEEHKQAGDIPALQGGGFRPAMRHGIWEENWSPSTRLTVGLLGGTILACGIIRRDILGTACGILGGACLARALTNLPVKRLTGIGAGRRSIDVQKTININAPVERVFEFFSNCRNFPHFMTNIHEVRDHGNGRFHWVVRGPAGIEVTWDADITAYQPNRLLAWRSVEGSTIANAGIIRFDPNHNGGTRVDIKLSYNPPAGAIGHAVARLFGADPKHEMDQDLLRAKTVIETGHPPHDAHRPIHAGQAG